jgi:electron transfer flavoprotein alpha subunit
MILVVAEVGEGKLTATTRELIGAARQLDHGSEITLLLLGSGLSAATEEATHLADQVLVADLPALAGYDAEVWAAVVTQIAQQSEAHTVLIAATRTGRDYSPRVAVKLHAPLLEDVVTLSYSDGLLTAQRGTWLGRVLTTIEARAEVAVISVKPGSFTAVTPAATAGEAFDVDLELTSPRVTVTGRTLEKSARIALAEADIVVAGGRGTGSAEGFTQLVEGLADTLDAAVAATRAVVDAGWRPYAEQVGQTGKTVQPKLYIAVGISGAVQHLSGMGKSRVIVALNKDADAPIFHEADYGIVGDVQQTVPALIAALQTQRTP